MTGLGAVSALGWGTKALWDGLERGSTAAAPLTLFDATGQRTRLAMEVPPGGPQATTRANAFAKAAAREALRSAGLRQARDAGLFFASTAGGMLEAEEFYAAVRARPRGPAGFHRLAAQQNNAPTDAVMRDLEIRGPVETIASACAAGAMALETALHAVRSCEVEIALCGGSDAHCRLTYTGFNSLRAVDAEPSRPFRTGHGGLSMGEGAGVLVLEPTECAADRGAPLLAEFVGAGSSCDAFHMTAPAPDGCGAAAAIRAALLDAGVEESAIDLVNAHGTGTPHNDAAEWAALRDVLGARADRVPVTSSKAIFGHLLGASGALEAVATVLCLMHGRVHATPGNGEIDPETPVDLVTGRPRPLASAATALSLNLGFGGVNAALIFRGVAS